MRVNVRCRECVDDGHVPSGAMARLPWNQGQAVRLLTVVSAEALRLFDCWNVRSNKSAKDQVIQPGMTLNSSRIFLASQGMLTERVRCGTAWTLVSLAECTAESKTNSYTDGAVIEMKPAGTDRDCMKPVTTVRCYSC